MVKFEVGSSVVMAGRARNAESIQYLEGSCGILQIGDDAGVILPEHNVIGLFDGAGGACDIGSPPLAAKVACRAVEQYFRTGGNNVAEALQDAREAVIANKDAGICVGAVMQIDDKKVMVANAGDTAAVLYREGIDDEKLYIADPQRSDMGGPLNYLGACDVAGRLPERVEDDYTCRELYPGDKLFLMTDGAWGIKNMRAGSLESYNFEAALNDWPMFEQAKGSFPDLEQKIRELLRSDAARELRKSEIVANTDELGRLHEDYMNVGLLDPDRYTLGDTDWLIWQEIVKPHLESFETSRRKIGMTAIAGAFLLRPIRWPFEAPPQDDATVAVVDI